MVSNGDSEIYLYFGSREQGARSKEQGVEITK